MGPLTEASRQGRLCGLVALRDALAGAVDTDADPRHLAAIARQLRDVLKEIDELERSGRKGSRVDELADRRQARTPTAENPARADRGGQRSRG